MSSQLWITHQLAHVHPKLNDRCPTWQPGTYSLMPSTSSNERALSHGNGTSKALETAQAGGVCWFFSSERHSGFATVCYSFTLPMWSSRVVKGVSGLRRSYASVIFWLAVLPMSLSRQCSLVWAACVYFKTNANTTVPVFTAQSWLAVWIVKLNSNADIWCNLI